jgi:hypothetical protein
MTHPPPEDADEVGRLLNTSKPLSSEEQRTLRTLAAAGWAQLNQVFSRKAKAAYAMAAPGDFGECVYVHMNVEQRAALVQADLYTCPVCNRLLKDRNTPVAASILLERGRLLELWLQVERANVEDREAALQSFRFGLGL